MSDPSVIIIGGGLAGLATGCYAQMNGYQCQVLEHGRHPGGVAAEWKRRGYTIDGGIHFYMGYRPGKPTHDIYRELGVYQADQYKEMSTYGRFVVPARDQVLDVTKDLDHLAETMKRLSPGDAGFVDRMIKGAKTFSHTDMSSFMGKPPEMVGVWDNLKMIARSWRALRYFSGWSMQPMRTATQRLANPWLAEVFNHLFLPGVPVTFIMMLLGALADGNMAIRKDGSGGFARALERRFLDLGGQVRYRASVEKILVENGRARGVRLTNQEEIRSGRVVSAADGFSTLYHMLDGRFVTKQLKEMHETWPLWKPVVLINYGVTRGFPDEPSIVMLKRPSPAGAGCFTSDWYVIRIFNYCPNCAPQGKTLIQVMVESDWEYWKKLKGDEYAYKAEKKKTARAVLEHLDALWPGISKQVEMTNVATPHTWWRFTRNRRGSFEGFAITSKILSASVRRTLPSLAGFLMAGQWVVPGGGVVPTLLSGKHAVMLMCREDGIPFQTSRVDDPSG
jgi:phytoene desaturase